MPRPVSATVSTSVWPAACARHGQATAVCGVEVRVRQEVREDLPQTGGIDERARQAGPQIEVQGLAATLHPRPEQAGDLADGHGDVRRAAVQLDRARLDAGDVQQIVDELDESLGRDLHDADEVALARREALRVRQQLDEPFDRGERAAQLVRRGRRELALQALQARALGDITDRDDVAAAVLERGSGDRERPSIGFGRDLAGEGVAERDGQDRGAAALGLGPGDEPRDELLRSRVGRGHHAVGVEDDERVPEAADREVKPTTLRLDAGGGGLDVLGHRVERAREDLQLFRPLLVESYLALAAGEPAGRRRRAPQAGVAPRRRARRRAPAQRRTTSRRRG